MKHVVAGFLAVLAVVSPARAQSEGALRAFFEGRRVELKIDMPGTQDGVDLRADASRGIDYQEYGNRLKAYGTAIHMGEAATITLVKLKKDLIEFQLNGGGFGTFGDDTSTSVDIPPVEKSGREKELERLIRDEHDEHARRELQRELESLRDRRERENRRIEAERAQAVEAKKTRIATDRLRGGSRFNIRYVDRVPSGIRPEEVMAALADYVLFDEPGAGPKPAPPNESSLQPRKGMLRADVEAMFASPVQSAARREGSLTVATLVFERGDQRITADFVEDVLVRYAITSK